MKDSPINLLQGNPSANGEGGIIDPVRLCQPLDVLGIGLPEGMVLAEDLGFLSSNFDKNFRDPGEQPRAIKLIANAYVRPVGERAEKSSCKARGPS